MVGLHLRVRKINSMITHTFVSGNLAYEKGVFNQNIMGKK